MKSQEVRLGNLVEINSNIGYIWNISRGRCTVQVGMGVYDTEDSREAIKIKPIPLRQEWLEKMGFNRDMSDEGDELTMDLWEEYKLLWSKEGGLWLQCDDVSYNKPLNNIKYIHQLQNLYFALTGEELKVKEWA